jgi:hypothetical protein
MKTANITSAERKDDRSILLTSTDPFDGIISKQRYVEIRGGLSWPTAKGSAYFCVVGQEYIVVPLFAERAPAGPRILLAEYESKALSLSKFYSQITDIAEQLMCREFYVNMPEERFACGFQNDFDNFALQRHTRVYLQNAYDADNFFLGVTRIKESIENGNLIIPEDSIVFAQLQSLTRADLENSPEEIFFAINALRHVIGSYYRNAPFIAKSTKLEDRLRRIGARGTTHMAS